MPTTVLPVADVVTIAAAPRVRIVIDGTLLDGWRELPVVAALPAGVAASGGSAASFAPSTLAGPTRPVEPVEGVRGTAWSQRLRQLLSVVGLLIGLWAFWQAAGWHSRTGTEVE